MSDLRCLFIGGSGRSGTSAVVQALSRIDERFFTYPDIELKFLNESGGVVDLYSAFCLQFGFSRVRERLQEFRFKYRDWLLNGAEWGQLPLRDCVAPEKFDLAISRFIERLISPYIRPLSEDYFFQAARALVRDFAEASGNWREDFVFIEKTPHLILDYGVLSKMFPLAKFVVVLRDPRATAISATKFSWAGGVGDLSANIDWVRGYYESYLNVSQLFGENVLVVKIEELPAESSVLGNFILHNFPGPADIGFKFEEHRPWYEGLDTAVADRLNNELGDMALKLGYF